jgi:hypothetical protein
MPAESEPAFPDCVLPDYCPCRQHGYPQYEHEKCLVPAINEVAIKIGWDPPYDYFPLTNPFPRREAG